MAEGYKHVRAAQAISGKYQKVTGFFSLECFWYIKAS